MKIEFTNDFANLTDSMSLKMMHGILFCVGEFIAFACYSGLIFYEVSNQLIGSSITKYYYYVISLNFVYNF